MDGLALIREIRTGRAPGAEAVPALALTAFARPEDRRRALVAGYEAHLCKPIEPLDLVFFPAGPEGAHTYLSRLRCSDGTLRSKAAFAAVDRIAVSHPRRRLPPDPGQDFSAGRSNRRR